MPRGHPGTAKPGSGLKRTLKPRGRPFEKGNRSSAKSPVSGSPSVSPVSANQAGEKRKGKPRGKPFEPGNRGNGGRPKGSPNKISRDLKEAYLLAANIAGGEEGLVGYLTKQALAFNPSPFMTGLSKLLPLMVEGNPDSPIIVERVRYTDDK
jgi:hypothetical protein